MASHPQPTSSELAVQPASNEPARYPPSQNDKSQITMTPPTDDALAGAADLSRPKYSKWNVRIRILACLVLPTYLGESSPMPSSSPSSSSRMCDRNTRLHRRGHSATSYRFHFQSPRSPIVDRNDLCLDVNRLPAYLWQHCGHPRQALGLVRTLLHKSSSSTDPSFCIANSLSGCS